MASHLLYLAQPTKMATSLSVYHITTVLLAAVSLYFLTFSRQLRIVPHDGIPIQRTKSSNSTDMSPYEIRNKGTKVLPDWARKATLPPAAEYENLPDICLVHIGKTAGSFLACQLGFLYDCDEDVVPVSPLPYAVQHLMHNNVNDCHDDDSVVYLLTTRNPLTRIQSWFDYEKPALSDALDQRYYYQDKIPFFVNCNFTTLNGMVASVVDQLVEEDCQKKARQAILGTKPFVRHNYYNYRYFLKQIPDDATLLSIRTEYLVRDWQTAEAWMVQGQQQQEASSTRPPRLSYHPPPPHETLTPRALEWICRYLCDEIQVYKSVLYRSVNLNLEQVQVSLNELAESCPKEVQATSCENESLETRRWRSTMSRDVTW